MLGDRGLWALPSCLAPTPLPVTAVELIHSLHVHTRHFILQVNSNTDAALPSKRSISPPGGAYRSQTRSSGSQTQSAALHFRLLLAPPELSSHPVKGHGNNAESSRLRDKCCFRSALQIFKEMNYLTLLQRYCQQRNKQSSQQMVFEILLLFEFSLRKCP